MNRIQYEVSWSHPLARGGYLGLHGVPHSDGGAVMGALALLSPRVWLELAVVAAVVAFGWWGYNTIYDRGAASVQVKWDAEKQAVAIKIAADKAIALDDERLLQQEHDKQVEVKNAQIKNLNTQLVAALAGLSNHPERPTGGASVPTDTAHGAGCYPAQLYREDAGVAIKLAAEADQLRIDLAACQADYANAERTVNGK